MTPREMKNEIIKSCLDKNPSDGLSFLAGNLAYIAADSTFHWHFILKFAFKMLESTDEGLRKELIDYIFDYSKLLEYCEDNNHTKDEKIEAIDRLEVYLETHPGPVLGSLKHIFEQEENTDS